MLKRVGEEEKLAEAFAAFWKVFPRRVAKGAARRAFDSAVKKGASVEVLVASAARYASARAEEDPQYTKHPSTWLNSECWSDEPACMNGAPTIDGLTGELIRAEPPRRRRGDSMTSDDVLLLAMARAYGDQRSDEAILSDDELRAQIINGGGSDARH